MKHPTSLSTHSPLSLLSPLSFLSLQGWMRGSKQSLDDKVNWKNEIKGENSWDLETKAAAKNSPNFVSPASIFSSKGFWLNRSFPSLGVGESFKRLVFTFLTRPSWV